ncbi:MAG: dihydroorotate dehydrogenase electron transfer subunit [bacterium]
MPAQFDLTEKQICECPVLAVSNLTADIYLMRLYCPPISENVRPGQFVNIKVNEEFIPLLRKPFSVCRRSREQGWIEVLWKIIGKGTEIMAHSRTGDSINLLGPLGRGFLLPDEMEHALVVGGGIGVAPLPFLCEELLLKGTTVTVFLGAKTKDELSLVSEFQQMGLEVQAATEDGSYGRKGLVTDMLLETLTDKGAFNKCHIYSCGPNGLLKRLMHITADYDVEGQVCTETMMGCGFGICMGCPVVAADPEKYGRKYYLTCLDGPVFNARDIILDG